MEHSRPPPPPDPEPLQRVAANLAAVRGQLATMVVSMRQERERAEARREAAASALAVPPGGLEAELVRLTEERREMGARLAEVEALHRGVCDELVALQDQVVHAAGLHTALRRLHEAGNRDGIVEAVQDIVINIIGSEDMALVTAEDGGSLRVAAALGTLRPLPLGGGLLPAALAQGAILVGEAAGRVACGALACVPFRARDQVAGGLLLFGLLPQKPALCPDDLEVLELLQVHVALALHATAAGGAAHAVR